MTITILDDDRAFTIRGSPDDTWLDIVGKVLDGCRGLGYTIPAYNEDLLEAMEDVHLDQLELARKWEAIEELERGARFGDPEPRDIPDED